MENNKNKLYLFLVNVLEQGWNCMYLFSVIQEYHMFVYFVVQIGLLAVVTHGAVRESNKQGKIYIVCLFRSFFSFP